MATNTFIECINVVDSCNSVCSHAALRWLKKIGGVEAIYRRNIAKAKLLYDEVDRNSLFRGTVESKPSAYFRWSFSNSCMQPTNACTLSMGKAL